MSPGTSLDVIEQAAQLLPGVALLTVLHLALLAASKQLCALTQHLPAGEDMLYPGEAD